MTRREIATNYLKFLANDDVEQVIALFSASGIVESPVYGQLRANQFYSKLMADTSSSDLHLKGIFEDQESDGLALYFKYTWILKNKEQATFDVVDILEFDSENKISKLTIIYDTVHSRPSVHKLHS